MSPRGRVRGGRSLFVGGTAAVLVVIIALVAGLFSGDGPNTGLRTSGSLAAAVTGTTDLLLGEDTWGDPAIPVARDREEPSREQWLQLLPRLRALGQSNPEDISVRRKLALAYYNLGRLDAAVDIYEGLLATEEEAVLRNRLGNALRDLGDPAGAEGAYRRAIEDDAALASPYLNLAELLWRLGRTDEAVAVLDSGLVSVPEESRPALSKGRQVLLGESKGVTR